MNGEIRDKHTSVGGLEIGPINWSGGLTDDAPEPCSFSVGLVHLTILSSRGKGLA